MDKKSIFFMGFSIVILFVMLYFVGIDNVIDALKIAKMEFIVLAIATQIFTYYLYTLRWKILNNLADIDVGIKKLLPIVLVGLAVNNITPSGRGGGEPVRAYILAKQDDNYRMEETFATVVADRALDTFPFVLLAVITIIAATLYFDLDLWLLILMIVSVIVIIAVLILLIYMSINPNFGKRVEGWIVGLVRRFYKKNNDEFEGKIHNVIVGFQDTMKLLISNKQVTSQVSWAPNNMIEIVTISNKDHSVRNNIFCAFNGVDTINWIRNKSYKNSEFYYGYLQD